MNSPLFFVHIPKSAGTSFRNAFEQQFGLNRVMRDYSPKAPETSAEVLTSVYRREDIYAFGKKLLDGKTVLLAGHFTAIKYARILPIENMTTFVREPVGRVISEFKHFQRHRGYDGSLLKFAKQTRSNNVQSAFLREVPILGIGFTGITELYQEAIAIFNKQFNMNIPMLFNNTAPREALLTAEFEPQVIEKIIELNQKDIKLYQFLLRLHEQRKALHQKMSVILMGSLNFKIAII
ncbi:sulfotransferase family 2 domain-containing protein [uncultured Paraglaciecola sp.]|jgi:hypothetical protein|uniref:sulfotransferase family 2 domain-containing protein n=1 Tax=uncultured Paraglaciecola sp. TaxID=1765024 RepID=UPI002620F2F4|nr:sulfotransferase family 2 domain-containing protein [uncultured Paraglaciecola sp.]